MDVDVEVSVLEALKLGVIQLRPRRNSPDALCRFVHWNDHGTILPSGSQVNMRHRAVDTRCGHATRHRLIGSDCDGPCAASRRGNGRNLLRTAQGELNGLSAH